MQPVDTTPTEGVEQPVAVAPTVNIPDRNLRAKIETALGKASGAPITTADMATLTELNAYSANISRLTGCTAIGKLLSIRWIVYHNLGLGGGPNFRWQYSLYFYTLTAGDFSATRKMLILK